MDNAFKENKHRWLLGWCCDLVGRGWFEKIVVSFLLPGMNEDVDRLFSLLWRALIDCDVTTLEELKDVIKKALSRSRAPSSKVKHLTEVASFRTVSTVYDFKKTLDPVLASNIKHTSEPLGFLFEIDPSTKVSAFTNKWC
eukprot:TRINITY_DN1042_c0_g2_i12.p1 TRINITY_DN1042_c0_g2~~TRINITY_DN1042_c0_g2_i12.p1  ORF type:complete len:140 (+),score=10.80 TRINITY_DN1042_c0_g2_i12:140-559(+)